MQHLTCRLALFAVLAGCGESPVQPEPTSQPADHIIATSDTALHIGGQAQLSAVVRTATFDTLDVPVAFSTSSGHIDVTASGFVTAVSYGVAEVEVRAAGLSESVTIGVVPPGRFTSYELDPAFQSGRYRVIVTNTDGSGLRHVLSTLSHGQPSWMPDGRRILFDADPAVLILEPGFTPQEVPPPAGAAEYWAPKNPVAGADGEWIYFDARVPVAGVSYGREIWRVRPNGEGYERVGPPGSLTERDVRPSPSPEGDRVVYVNEIAAGGPSLFKDVASGAVDTLDIRGDRPRWSPNGQWIAFQSSSGVEIARPDGSERQIVSPGSRPVWSPDGAWLAFAVDPNEATFFHLSSGVTTRSPGMPVGNDWARPTIDLAAHSN